MMTNLPSSCESIMPRITNSGDITLIINIDGVSLLLLIVLLVVLCTVLWKIAKLIKSIFG